ncbi:MAG: ketopantoate reductase family protein [Planctomycetaceae bacterium]|nr:ketopantoate reductase family protein [Planctomycetaceae bacterium]
MRVLVYGAGNIGSLYAAKLKQSGNNVAILARGNRFDEVHEHGLWLREFRSGRKIATRVDTVDQLAPDDSYDLVLVILPRQSVPEVLPILAANRNTPSVMFLGNNASGPHDMIDSLGRERVLLGFPGAAAIRDGETIQYLILDRREQPTTIGELDGSNTKRIEAIANAFQSAGFPCATCRNMDAWLKTHVAEISPMANAFYMVGCSIEQLMRNREALGLMIRAIREGYRVLTNLGIPITPSSHKAFRWIPQFLLVAIARRKLSDAATRIKIGHAVVARNEMSAISNDLRELALRSGIATPATDQLRSYLDNDEPSATHVPI